MRPSTDIVRSIKQTEKGTRIAAHRQYLVEVSTTANKIEIRHAVEELFKVSVTKVNTMVCDGKWRRLNQQWGKRPDWKKAIVTVAKGQQIEIKQGQ